MAVTANGNIPSSWPWNAAPDPSIFSVKIRWLDEERRPWQAQGVAITNVVTELAGIVAVKL